MGALAGMLGSMMALEAIREIVGFGESLVGRLVMVDARAMRFETLRYARDPANPLNGDTPDDHRFERARGVVFTALQSHRFSLSRCAICSAHSACRRRRPAEMPWRAQPDAPASI